MTMMNVRHIDNTRAHIGNVDFKGESECGREKCSTIEMKVKIKHTHFAFRVKNMHLLVARTVSTWIT